VAQKIQVDIISDVVCPWCLIGYRQLEKALEIAGLEADIRWHPFELNPQMAPEGEDTVEHIQRKYGATPEQSATTRSHMKSIAEPLGIDFSQRSKRIWNTFEAHQLLLWAQDSGHQTDLKLKLFEAYFTNGENVSDREVLLNAVEAAGLNRAQAAEVLADGRYAQTVRALEQRWGEMGITGVPAMILAEKGLIMGAQEPERLAIALRKMAALTPAE
jgi:predicted DsbA family dithiol-disulfide isomerase